MIGFDERCKIILQVSLLGFVLTPAPSFAQVTDQTEREGFTGRELFEHEWRPILQSASSAAATKQKSRHLPLEARSAAEEARQLALGDGLGPMHNASSCAECHVAGGSSGVAHNVTLLTVDPRSEIVDQAESGADTLLELFPALLAADGTLLFEVLVHNRSTRNGYDKIRLGLAKYVSDGIDDSWFAPEKRTSTAIANRPVISGRYANIDFYLSQRNSPPLFGLGRIESISVTTILAIADRQLAESKGMISGRFVGKFGWRGQGNSLSGFVANACAVELGLTHASRQFFTHPRHLNPQVADDELLQVSGRLFARNNDLNPQVADPADPNYINRGVDLTSSEFAQLASYVSSIPQPIEVKGDVHKQHEVLDGEKLFYSIGCEQCHKADIHPVQGLFSDLLIHDMGGALQAPSPAPIGALNVRRVLPSKFKMKNPRDDAASLVSYSGGIPREIPVAAPSPKPDNPSFPRETGETKFARETTWDTLQREWRTPPLWGIADTAPYLHDGRAETLEAAIIWHGGEAEPAKEAYKLLSQVDKDLVLAFLSSLRAPESSD